MYSMQKMIPRVPFAGYGMLLLLLVSIPFLVFWYVKHNEIRHVNIRGQVIDHATGKPVPGARVVLSTYFSRFLYCPVHYFGVVADKDAYFAFDTEVPDPVHTVHVEASGPSDAYGVKTYEVTQIPKDIELKIGELPKTLQKHAFSKYDLFTGEGRPHSLSEMTFFGDGWEIRTLIEIEMGYQPAKVRPAKKVN